MKEATGHRFFYGWVMAAVSLGIAIAFGGGLYYSFGIFFPVMMAELGFSRGAGSTAFSMMLLLQAGISPLVGFLIVRVGLKKIMIAGCATIVAVTAAMSTVTHVWHVYLIYGIFAGLAIQSAGYISTLTLMNNWFIKRRGLATAICVSGPSIGTLFLAPICSYLIQTIGWRNTWLALAGMATLLALLPTILLVKPDPEAIGVLPDGERKSQRDKDNTAKPVAVTVDWDARSVLRVRSFWYLVIFGTVNLFAVNMLAAHQVTYLQDVGIAPVVAAGALGILVGTSTVGRMGGGILADRFSPQCVGASACVMEIIGIIILLNTRTLLFIYVYAIIFGLAYGTILAIVPSIFGAYFGRKNYGTIFGTAIGIINLVSALSPGYAGFVFDAVGNYFIPLITAAVLVAVGGVCILLARPPKAIT
ncbi:MAG: MFS transporter [Dehalococcoidales bacterium]|nr:MFS transporter [Dehalococcoidales bacterium]